MFIFLTSLFFLRQLVCVMYFLKFELQTKAVFQQKSHDILCSNIMVVNTKVNVYISLLH